MIKYLKNIIKIILRELYNSNQIRNDEIVKHINDALIELEKYIDIKKTS